jgi:hypothetical protein
MGVLAGLHMFDPALSPLIDSSGNFPAHVFEGKGDGEINFFKFFFV